MKKDRVIFFLKEAGFIPETGCVVSGDYLRFPCPFRQWNHIRANGSLPRGKGGDNYWLNVDTLQGGCYVCGDKSNLFDLLYFKGLVEDRPFLRDLAFQVLAETSEVNTNETDAAFEEGLSRMETKEKESRMAIEQLHDRFVEMKMHMPDVHVMLESFCRSRGHELRFLRMHFGVTLDQDSARLVQPLASLRTGEFIGLVGRSICGDMPKSKTYFGTKPATTFSCSCKKHFEQAKRYLLVEGHQFDMYTCYLRLKKMGLLEEIYPLGIGTSKISQDQAAILEMAYKPVFLMLDNDDAGKDGVNKARKLLDNCVPDVRQIYLPDEAVCYNVDNPEDFKGDPDSLKEDVFEQLIKGALSV